MQNGYIQGVSYMPDILLIHTRHRLILTGLHEEAHLHAIDLRLEIEMTIQTSNTSVRAKATDRVDRPESHIDHIETDLEMIHGTQRDGMTGVMRDEMTEEEKTLIHTYLPRVPVLKDLGAAHLQDFADAPAVH